MREDFDAGSRRPKKIAVIFSVVFLILIVFIGLYVLGASSKKTSTPIVPAVTQTPTSIPVVTQEVVTPSPTGKQIPTPSPKPGKITSTPTPTKQSTTLDRSNLEVAVLNGSGVAGAAKGISSYLTSLGYNVKTVANAKTFDYKNLTIFISKAKSAYLPQLKKDLAQKSASISASVDDTIDTDAEVIVGK